jgi:hypothetical protein
MIRRFLTALLLLALAMVLQFSLRGFLGFYSNLTLSALIVFSMSVSLPEIIFLTLASVFVLNPQPAFSWDMLVFGLLPMVSFYTRRLVKWKPWILSLTMVLLSFLAMYLILSPTSLIREPLRFFEDAFAALAFGAAAFFVFSGSARGY